MLILHWLNREESIKETARVPYQETTRDDKGKFTLKHNHVICYGKSENFQLGVLDREDHHNKAYSNPDNVGKVGLGAEKSGNLEKGQGWGVMVYQQLNKKLEEI